MNRRTFDLILVEWLAIAAAFVAPRLWATKELITGSGKGVAWETARVVKTVTA